MNIKNKLIKNKTNRHISSLFRAAALYTVKQKRNIKLHRLDICNIATKSMLAEPLLLHELRESTSLVPLFSFIRSADKHRWTAAWSANI